MVRLLRESCAVDSWYVDEEKALELFHVVIANEDVYVILFRKASHFRTLH
mgnify:CR=1 FL=1